MTSLNDRHVAIVGAGPVGLEAALAAARAGFSFTLYEAGDEPARHVRDWGHVRLFSPWDLDASDRMRRRLREAGHDVPTGDACPTGAELVERVLDPVAKLPDVAARTRYGSRVVAVSRRGMLKDDWIGAPERGRGTFRLLVEDADGGEAVESADVVLDCSGTYGNPNATGDGGIPAPGERALGDAVRRTLPDLAAEADAWAGRTTLLVGDGHSARTAVLELAALARERPGTRVVWVLRSAEPRFGADPDDPLPSRARLAREAEELARGGSPAVEPRPGTVVERFAPATSTGTSSGAPEGRETNGRRADLHAGAGESRWVVTLRGPEGRTSDVAVDRVLSLTGYVGDHTMYRQLQVHECWATTGPMKLAASLLASGSDDCLAGESHGVDVLRHPEPGFFVLGAKSYGRNSAFLMRTGWEQVSEVFASLVG